MKPLAIITLLASGLWVHTASAQSLGPERLQLIRVTGMIVPYETQPRGAMRTVSIVLNDKPWLFQISDATAIADSGDVVPDTTDGSMLKDVRFTGPDALMRRLQKDTQPGRPLTLEGQLDAKERWFRVTAVEETRDTLLPKQ
jgi:hypothetical protein